MTGGTNDGRARRGCSGWRRWCSRAAFRRRNRRSSPSRAGAGRERCGAAHPRSADPRARPRLQRRGRHRRARGRQRLDDELERRPLFPAAERQQILGGADRLRPGRRRRARASTSAVTIRREDLTLFHQPIAAQIGAERLYDDARQPDLPGAHPERQHLQRRRAAHTPAGPTRCARCSTATGIDGIRFGPGERLLQSQIAGLQWQPGLFGRPRLLRGAQRACPPSAGARPSSAISPIRSTARRRDGHRRRPRPAAARRAAVAAPRPSGCSRSCRRPGPGRSG